MRHPSLVMLVGALLVAGCATPIPPAEPSAMVPKMLKTTMPADTGIYVARPTLGSAAEEKVPGEELTGRFPLVQEQGLTNYQESIRLALVAAGAQTPANERSARYVLRSTILGGMVLPFQESYSILFVHYQLEDAKTGKTHWSKNVYSQAKMEMPIARPASSGPHPGYALVAAANLRQMVTGLSEWLATTHQVFLR